MDWDKGKAVQHIVAHRFKDPSTIVVYIGDDTTDEDAFKVVRELNGIAILVSKERKETDAEFVVADPENVLKLLKRFAKIAPPCQDQPSN
jgi:trehalose-phosphatase